MSEALLGILFFVLWLIFFSCLWMGILALLSRASGWARLARRFAIDRPPSGEVFNWSSARFGFFSSYNGILQLGVSEKGIHLRPIIIFRYAHKPLLLPWRAIERLEQKKLWLFPSVRFTIARGSGYWRPTITLYGARLLKSVQRYAPKRLTKG